MSKRDAGFVRGGRGVFKCGVCGKLTRETGDSEHLCASCYYEAGLENEHNDHGGDKSHHTNESDNVSGLNRDCPVCRAYTKESNVITTMDQTMAETKLPKAKKKAKASKKTAKTHTLSLVSNCQRMKDSAIQALGEHSYAERGVSALLVLDLSDEGRKALRLLPGLEIHSKHTTSDTDVSDLESDVLYHQYFGSKESNVKKADKVTTTDSEQAAAGEETLASGRKDRAEGRKDPAKVGKPAKQSKAELRAIEKRARVEARALKKAGKSVVVKGERLTKAKGEKKVRAPKAPREKREGNIPMMARMLIAGNSNAEILEAFTARYTASAHEAKHEASFVQQRIDIYRKIAMRIDEVKAAVAARAPKKGKKGAKGAKAAK